MRVVASGCDVQVSLGAAGYALATRGAGCDSGAFATGLPHPARPGDFSAPPPAGVSVGAATFHFDRIGRPRDAGGVLLTTPTVVTLGSRTLRVEPETGYARLP